jgi:putative flippase GtrA
MLLKKDIITKFITYSFVGVICTLIYFISVFIIVERFGQNPVYGSTLAFIIMTVFSFLLNKKYTFGGEFTFRKLLRFLMVSLIGFILNFGIMYTVCEMLSFHYSIGELVTILVIPLVNFTLNNFWTFR